MMIAAADRASAADFPLFLHVFGATLLTGALFTVALSAFLGWKRDGDGAALNKLAFRSVIWAALPAYVLMRVGAQWVEVKEGWDKVPEDDSPLWLGVGYMTADPGALLLLISVVLSAIGLKKLRAGHGLKLSRATGIIATLMLVAYVVTIWAMTAKPV